MDFLFYINIQFCLKKNELPRLESLEALACKITIHDINIIIVATYKQPNKVINGNDLRMLKNVRTKVLITGNLNCKHPTWNSRRANPNGNLLYQILQHMDLDITAPAEPTFYPKGKGAPDVLDVVLFKMLRLPQVLQVIHALNSDHLPVMFTVDCVIHDVLPPVTYKRIVNWNYFTSSLHSLLIVPKQIPNKSDLDNEILILTDQIQTAYHCSTEKIPLRTSKTEDSTIPILLQIKNFVRRQYQKYRHPLLKSLMNKFKEKIHKRIIRKRIQLWNKFLLENDRPQHSFWKINKSLKQKGHSNIQSPLHDENCLLFSPSDKAETFAKYMELQFTHHDLRTPMDFFSYVQCYLSSLKYEFQLPGSALTTPQEIWKLIKKLSNNKASGPDGITNEQLKHLPRKAIVIICKLVNRMLQLGYFPIVWQNAYICMIHKPRTDPKIPTNYRPISLLSNLSKLSEKVILLRINMYVEQNDLLPPEQFGFRKGYGTDVQLLRIIDFISTKFSRKLSVLGLFLDAEKAYDKIWHNGLLYKMLQMKIPMYLIVIIQSFLSNRTFQIKQEHSLSSTRRIMAGVPQGAVLSPILFNLYVADIPRTPYTLLSMFADDIAIFSNNKNLNIAYYYMKIHINLLEKWTVKWRMKINTNKSAIVPFTWKRKLSSRHVYFNGQQIPIQNSTKYLGIIMDQKLLFKDHINSILNKATARYIQLYSLFKSPALSLSTKIILYKAVVRSVMTYAGGIWKFAAKTHKNKLQVLQNKILRTISGFSLDTKIIQLHEDLEVDMLDEHLSQLQNNMWSRIREHGAEIIKTIGSEPLLSNTWRTPR
mgnify:CR=1 FL=1